MQHNDLPINTISHKYIKKSTSVHPQTSSSYYKILLGESDTEYFGQNSNVSIPLEEEIRRYKTIEIML